MTKRATKTQFNPVTTIMDPYKDNNMSCRIIYRLSNGPIIYLIKIGKTKKLIFKSLVASSLSTFELIMRNYRITNSLAIATNHAVKIIDMRKKDLENNKFVFEVLMEYEGHDLYRFNSMSEEDFLNSMYQLVSILSIMEFVGIFHSDIKPQNIIWNSTKKVLKLLDFETALEFTEDPKKIFEHLPKHKLVGYTESFTPMEYYNKTEIIPQKFDAYSFGSTFIIMLSIVRKIKINRKKIDKKTILNLKTLLNNDQYSYLVNDCFKNDPNERPTIKDLKKIFYEYISKTSYKYIIESSNKNTLDDLKKKINT